jgi:hypothetical protein
MICWWISLAAAVSPFVALGYMIVRDELETREHQ